tara:strand:+ start:519 stop:695 length:177 start_codon:yes stop_codon:yes gene_type:complete
MDISFISFFGGQASFAKGNREPGVEEAPGNGSEIFTGIGKIALFVGDVVGPGKQSELV